MKKHHISPIRELTIEELLESFGGMFTLLVFFLHTNHQTRNPITPAIANIAIVTPTAIPVALDRDPVSF